MSKSHEHWAIAAAGNPAIWLVGLLLLMSTFTGCSTPPSHKPHDSLSYSKATGPQSVAKLIKALGDNESEVRMNAAEALGRIGPDANEAGPALIEALSDSDYAVRYSAAEALGEIGYDTKEAIRALIKALGDPDSDVRWRAASALGSIGLDAKEAVPALIHALGDDHHRVRYSAAEALGKMGAGAKEAVPALTKMLGNEPYGLRVIARSALEAIGADPQELIPSLELFLVHGTLEVRREAAEMLGNIGPGAKEAVPALIKALGNHVAYVRMEALKAIGKVGATAESVGPALTEVLNDPDPDVRQEALSVLQQIEYTGDDFLETLEKIANKDSDYDMRKLASDTLRKTKFAILARDKTPGAKATPPAPAPIPERQKPAFHPKALAQRWAVAVGISQYQDTRIPSLRYAAVDARSLYDWLISPQGGGYAPSRVNLMIDGEATVRNIKEALFEWLGQALEEDIVTIYFAGHGSPQSPDHTENLFLLPYDTQYDNIASTGFPMWDIETALKRFIKAKRVVVIADACHAAGVGQSFDVARRAGRGMKVNPISTGLQNLSRVGEGVCVISASDEKQLSQEGRQWGGGHGVFTYFLLQGLEGQADYNKDTRVMLGELIPFLSEKVRRATRNAQSPIVAGKFDPALTIAR
ncbi:MAG: HEAT repeat domain-containing protein [Deltaproteobacteria bacterium]|nr:MAG: HEAT repeat domain-containing protein [Deltaproteobacteria bacterium]